MLFLLGVLLGMFSGAIAVATFKENEDDRYAEGFQAGLEYAKHEMKWPDE